MRLKNKWKRKLYQAKKRNKKVIITDVAIEKIPFIRYEGLTNEENQIMYALAKQVLRLSKEENQSNEVAITYDLDREHPYGIALGDEHSVDVCSDTRSFHILVSAERATVVMLHNHPSTKTFSLADLRFLLTYDSIKLLIVISNQGTIHYIYKTNEYDRSQAIQLYAECVAELHLKSLVKELYQAALRFLARCSEVGLYYK